MTLRLPPLYAITDRSVSGVESIPEIADRLFRTGVSCVQVREKSLTDRELLAAVEEVRRLAAPRSARVFVNDRVDVARLAGVGVHLGELDLPAVAARRLLPAESAIGVSTHDVEAARRAFAGTDADYVAFGPVFESATRRGRSARGLDALATVARGKTRPLVAIGGITADSIGSVLDAGADSAAAIAGLLAGGRIEENSRRMLDAIRSRTPAGRVYLVGFMGAGKTAVGRRIAERVGAPFVDVDAEVERTSGLTIRALFESSGEAAFRERESLFLSGTELLENVVVATGGGAFVPEPNRRLMQRLGRVVFLDVPFEVIEKRLASKTDRPLFSTRDQAADLYARRQPFYRMGTIRVALDGTEGLDEAADLVLTALSDRLAGTGAAGPAGAA